MEVDSPVSVQLDDHEIDKAFHRLADRLDASWERIATSLGFLNDEIESIKRNNTKTDKRIFQMLVKWKSRLKSLENIWDSLAEALVENGWTNLALALLQGTCV